MELPTPRELELEALLRRRDEQLARLTDELTHLRTYLATQPPPVTSDPVSLPPSFVSFLLPHLNSASADASTGSTSGTVATALTARNKLLQDENDELYELLKSTETGRLKEEARGLKRAVSRLELALKDSHQIIKSLSDELDKTHDAALPVRAKTNMYASMNPPASNGSAKPVPTGPRAQKRQRVGEPPGMSSANSIPVGRQTSNNHGSERGTSARPLESVSRDPTPIVPPPDHRKVPGGKVEPIDDDRGSRASRAASRDESRSRSSRHHERDRASERDRGSERGRDSIERTREREHTRDKDRPRERERSRGDRDRGHDQEKERGEPRDRVQERARDRPREERERPREDREKERERARVKSGEDRERPREREREREPREKDRDAGGRDPKDRGDRTSRRSGGRRRHGGGGGGGGENRGGGNGGRRQSSVDRSLANRMGL
ncbi:hypothetical protein PENSPDRAFT_680573 [Peniophora sp. CONT]|nr:hypothetical protein PENSPDRAFT_680573 [Peniophora sp. CONT]